MSNDGESSTDCYDAHLSSHREAMAEMATDSCRAPVLAAAQAAAESVAAGGKVVFFGNGGSAADAQHLATELVVRYVKDRAPIAAIALTTDTSSLTAAGNDLGFDGVFSRQVEALVREGDVVVAISTSGDSPNVLLGAAAAKMAGATVVGFTKSGGGKLGPLVDIHFAAPTAVTAIAQECHLLAGHILCDIVERSIA